MAQDKKSFILYCDQKGVWDKLNNEQAGKLIKHILSYVNDENPEAPDFITELAFEPIKQQLKRDLKNWEKQYEQRVEAGRKSAEVRKRNATTVDDRSVSSTVNVNGNVNGNVNVIGIKRDFSVTILSKYLNENPILIYDLQLYFEKTGQAEQMKLANLNRFDDFMKKNPAGIFNDADHLYKTFRKFHEGKTNFATPKSKF